MSVPFVAMRQPANSSFSDCSITDDDQVLADARQRLAACGYCDVRQVECEIYAGILTLRGSVASYYRKQVAQEAVRHVPGVRTVLNLLIVAGVRIALTGPGACTDTISR